jgi:hypothetical protein
MQSEFGGLEQGLMVLVLILGAAVLVLALVFMIVSLQKLMSPQQAASAAPPAPAPGSTEPTEKVESVVPAVAVVEEPVVVPKAKSDLDHGDEIPEDLLPVLIAAAATAIGKPVRVKDVVLVHAEKPNVWGTQGRIVIQRSHDTGSHQW